MLSLFPLKAYYYLIRLVNRLALLWLLIGLHPVGLHCKTIIQEVENPKFSFAQIYFTKAHKTLVYMHGKERSLKLGGTEREFLI